MIKKTLILIAMVAFTMTACSPTPDSIIEKYEEYSHVEASQNKLGIQTYHEPTAFPRFTFANISDYLGQPKENFHQVKENMKSILSERFVILDANNPTKHIAFETIVSEGTPNYPRAISVLLQTSEMPRFVLVGFKGVRESESAQWNTPSMFFLLENVGNNLRSLTSEPFLAENLFQTDFSEAKFIEAKPVIPVINSKYEDRINLGGNKTLSISFSLSEKGGHQTLTECKISVETSTKNTAGSTRAAANNFFGYDIAVASDGTFNQTISDYSVSGKVDDNRIMGAIRNGNTKHSYMAKPAKPELGNVTIYKSIESTTLMQTKLSNPFKIGGK